jgi:hypothetical protein
MSKYTTAVIMPSEARIGPWGDDRWRFAGAIQYVSKGPDFLWAQSASLGVDEPSKQPFASMTVRNNPADKAADIAVMVFALLQVDEWSLLHPWWDNVEGRGALRHVLEGLVEQYRGMFKLAVVETEPGGIGEPVLKELAELGFEIRTFTDDARRVGDS